MNMPAGKYDREAPSQVFNFLWLHLDMPPPPDPENGSIREPLPGKYIKNVRKAGRRFPEADIVLWVDSRRLTERQYAYLQDAIETDRPNVTLRDLRDIPAYNRESLFNQPETNPNWRNGGQNTLIWRQVDAAKVLVCLQGNYDQTFFADLDHAHLGITSPEVQGMIRKHGLMFGSVSKHSRELENQLWGFDRERRGFFAHYYASTLECAYKGQNGFYCLIEKVLRDLTLKEWIDNSAIVLPIGNDGSSAVHTGHEFRAGRGGKLKPSLVPGRRLAQVFNKRRAREENRDVSFFGRIGALLRPPKQQNG